MQYIGLPTLTCSRRLCPGWSHHTPRSRKPQPSIGARSLIPVTNIIESMNSIIRQVCRNVKRWRDASMALRWTAAGMMEAKKGFRRLRAHKQLPTLRSALLTRQMARQASAVANDRALDQISTAA